MTADIGLARDLIAQLDGWANNLAAPLLPPIENPNTNRIEFRHQTPHAVMVGKCIRAVSGINAALVLADLGYVVESAAITRIVSDFCTEITAIGEALQTESKLPRSVSNLVEQYFVPRPRTPDEYKRRQRPHYPSRKNLMEAETRMAQRVGIDGDKQRILHEFINSGSDAYVHGAYETTMELYDPGTNRFIMRGDRDQSQHRKYVQWVSLKLHEVVCALELTAAVTAHEEVWKATRHARHTLDKAEGSELPSQGSDMA